jgi:DNA-binding response OmpR family regulator
MSVCGGPGSLEMNVRGRAGRTIASTQEVTEVSATARRVRVPETLPRERVVLGELHLLRGRLDGVLDQIGVVLRQPEVDDEAWPRVEEATRLACRALVAALGAVPPLPAVTPTPGVLRVGELRVDPASGRQWYGEAEFELTPLHHRLLAVMAAEPCQVFGRDELASEVWRRPGRAEAVKVSVSRLRRALVAAGAPGGRFLVSVHGVGWSLTRPS